MSIPDFQSGGESSSLSFRTKLQTMSILSPTFEQDWVLSNERQLIGRQLRSRLEDVIRPFEGSILSEATRYCVELQLNELAATMRDESSADCEVKVRLQKNYIECSYVIRWPYSPDTYHFCVTIS